MMFTNPLELAALERVLDSNRTARAIGVELGIPLKQLQSWVEWKWERRFGWEYGVHPLAGWFGFDREPDVRAWIARMRWLRHEHDSKQCPQ